MLDIILSWFWNKIWNCESKNYIIGNMDKQCGEMPRRHPTKVHQVLIKNFVDLLCIAK